MYLVRDTKDNNIIWTDPTGEVSKLCRDAFLVKRVNLREYELASSNYEKGYIR